MTLLGTAYAASDIDRDISLDQWVAMCGATNGAADAFGVSPEDRHLHRSTAQSHLMRYATEAGLPLDQFDGLFEHGKVEGKKLITARSVVIAPARQGFITGFQHDKTIDYRRVKDALDS
jgi:hypothetical protein